MVSCDEVCKERSVSAGGGVAESLARDKNSRSDKKALIEP